MARKKQTSNPYPSNDITIMGDSMTSYESAMYYGNIAFQCWGKKLQDYLRRRGCNVQSRILGRGGDTTAQFLGRGSYINLYSTPKGGIIFGTPNDPVSSISGSATAGASNTITLDANASQLQNSYVGNVISITTGTGSGQVKKIISYDHTNRIAKVESNWATNPVSGSGYAIAAPDAAQMQANHQALIKIYKFNVRGTERRDSPVTLWSQADLPIGAPGQRYIILNDTSLTGGAPKNRPSQHNNIAGNYSLAPKQSVWEYRNARAGEAGWARVAIESTPPFEEGCSMIITAGPAYLNFPSGGDNYNATTGVEISVNAGNKTARLAAAAAAAAEGTVFCDIAAYQSMLINGGTFFGNTILPETAQGSGEFHYDPNNQHWKEYGNDSGARCFDLCIAAQPNWIQKLSA